jgi:drug/metabolite transporter (DMT)-like permease
MYTSCRILGTSLFEWVALWLSLVRASEAVDIRSAEPFVWRSTALTAGIVSRQQVRSNGDESLSQECVDLNDASCVSREVQGQAATAFIQRTQRVPSFKNDASAVAHAYMSDSEHKDSNDVRFRPSIKPFLEQNLKGRRFTYIVPSGNASDDVHSGAQIQVSSRSIARPTIHAGHTLSSSDLNRSFAITCCVVAIVAMLSVRAWQQVAQCTWLIFSIDLAVWYILTSVNMASSHELLILGDGLVVNMLALVQIFAGITMLPFGHVANLTELSLHHLYIITLCGSCFYFFGFFMLEGLLHGGIILVSSVRALEPFSTTFIMVMFAGESLNGCQYLAIFAAVVGIIIARPFAGGDVSMSNLAVVASCLFANLLNSLRNVFLHEASKLGFRLNSKILVYALCSCMALPAGIAMLALHQTFHPIPVAIRSVFPDPSLLMISAVSFVLYNVASFLVLMRVGPVTHVVLLAGKRVVTALLACALAGEMPTRFESVGMCVTTASVYAFEVARRTQTSQSSAGNTHEMASNPAKQNSDTSEQHIFKQLLLSSKGVGISMCALTVACFCMMMCVETFF